MRPTPDTPTDCDRIPCESDWCLVCGAHGEIVEPRCETPGCPSCGGPVDERTAEPLRVSVAERLVA